MRTALRLVAAAVVALAVVFSLLLIGVLLWPQRSDDVYAEGPSSPRLVVLPHDWTGRMFAELHGSLAVNDQQCVTLGDDVVVAGPGSRVSADGRSVILWPGRVELPLHAGFVGGGGFFGGRDWLESNARGSWDDDLVDALEACLGHDGNDVV